MLTLSKPISAGQAQAYHRSEFANAKGNYYTEARPGVWPQTGFAVVRIVAVKAARTLKNQSAPNLRLQIYQSKAVAICRFQWFSIIACTWFGTRGSEVQILSPRPIKSIIYSPFFAAKKRAVVKFVTAKASKFNKEDTSESVSVRPLPLVITPRRA